MKPWSQLCFRSKSQKCIFSLKNKRQEKNFLCQFSQMLISDSTSSTLFVSHANTMFYSIAVTEEWSFKFEEISSKSKKWHAMILSDARANLLYVFPKQLLMWCITQTHIRERTWTKTRTEISNVLSLIDESEGLQKGVSRFERL